VESGFSAGSQPAESGGLNWGLLTLALVLLGFFAHRLLVILSAGDFLYPLEPSEAKNTQIAWDLISGRYGSGDFTLGNYLANSGSVHHASYSSGALVYWLLSQFTALDLLSVRLVPLLASTAALGLWMMILRRTFNSVSAALAGLGLLLVPTLFIAFQLTFLNCHPESVLPLTGAIGAWLWWLDGRPDDARRGLLLGACVGYAFIFSYLLWPFLGLLLLLTFVGPRPQLSHSQLKSLSTGLLLGLWPLWLILLNDPLALFTYSITEREETTLFNMMLGRHLNLELYLQTVRENLPYAFHDYWLVQEQASKFWGGQAFEGIAYKLLTFGPLILLPWALLEAAPQRRRLALMVALAPPLVYLWLAFASPWKPNVPVRYLVPLGLLGFSAPAVGIGLAMGQLKSNRNSAWLLLLLCSIWTLWLLPPRAKEASASLRLERAPLILEHRYVTYYNLGIGTVWAEQVQDVNDLIDVRSAQGKATGFSGIQAGLWGSGRRLALGEGDWQAPQLSWEALFSGIQEWAERQSYLPYEGDVGGDLDDDPHRPVRDDLAVAAFNIGWAAGIRASWDSAVVVSVVEEAQGQAVCPEQPADWQRPCWPSYLDWQLFWEGYGFGLGRARPGISAHPDSLPTALPPEARLPISTGISAGRAMGQVPEAPRQPLFKSVRGPAT
tara:strand:+ start:351 stop:2351 length:2001 start_codon:yes stop_codon:yes gene_type:complete